MLTSLKLQSLDRKGPVSDRPQSTFCEARGQNDLPWPLSTSIHSCTIRSCALLGPVWGAIETPTMSNFRSLANQGYSRKLRMKRLLRYGGCEFFGEPLPSLIVRSLRPGVTMKSFCWGEWCGPGNWLRTPGTRNTSLSLLAEDSICLCANGAEKV